MTVLDSSIYASLVLGDQHYKTCRKAFEEHVKIGDNATLDLAYVEAANALWKHISLLKRIPLSEGSRRLEILKVLVYQYSKTYHFKDYVENALKLALDAMITVYDALYLTLTKSLNTRLLTIDSDLALKLRNTPYENLVTLIENA